MSVRQQPDTTLLARRISWVLLGLMCFVVAGPLFDTMFAAVAPALILVGLGCLASAATVGL
jgi:hypothetical protein